VIRAVVDANVWVSAFLKPESVPGQVVTAWAGHEFDAHVAAVTIVEVARALTRPKLAAKYRVSWPEVIRFVGDLVAGATVHHVADPPRRCRDRTDDVLLELGVRLAPCHLVTGDADLVKDDKLAPTMAASGLTIMMPAGFLGVLKLAQPAP